jgi:hypothetical protein
MAAIGGVWSAATTGPGRIPEWLFGLITLGFAAFVRADVPGVMARATADRLAQIRLALTAGLALLVVGGVMRLLSTDRVHSAAVANLGLLSVLWGQYRAGMFRTDASSFPDR